MDRISGVTPPIVRPAALVGGLLRFVLSSAVVRVSLSRGRLSSEPTT
jgi:hypothetical protein